MGGDANGSVENRVEFGSTINLGDDVPLEDGKYHLYAVWAKDETYTMLLLRRARDTGQDDKDEIEQGA